jgi:pullulanase/glycogen debranching enzyme
LPFKCNLQRYTTDMAVYELHIRDFSAMVGLCMVESR